MATAEIIVVRHVSTTITGAGNSYVVSRHASGPRGWRNAIRSHYDDCRTANRTAYGSGWIEVVAQGNGPGTGITIDHLPGTYDDIQPPRGAGIEWWQETAGYGIGVGCLPSLDRVTRDVRPWNGATWVSRGKSYGSRAGTYCAENGSHCFVSGVCASCGLKA